MLRTGCEMTPFLAQLHRACIGLASTSDRGPIGLTSEVETAGDIAAKLGDRCTPVVAHHTHHIRKTAELHNSIYMCDSLPIARALSSIEGSFGHLAGSFPLAPLLRSHHPHPIPPSRSHHIYCIPTPQFAFPCTFSPLLLLLSLHVPKSLPCLLGLLTPSSSFPLFF